MKKILFTFVFVAISSLTYAGPVFIPASVKKAFHNHFPDVKNVKWVKSDKLVEADFELGNHLVNAFFTKDGDLVETDVEIRWFDLPYQSRAYIAENIPGGFISRLMKIQNKREEAPYIVEIKKNNYIYSMNFGDNGDLLEFNKAKEKVFLSWLKKLF